jgi:hypothetical protein
MTHINLKMKTSMNKQFMKIIFLLLLLPGCAYVHHTQIGDVVSSDKFVSVPIEILVSETGINIQEAGKIGKAVIQDRNAGNNVAAVAAIIGLFQMGPTTGNPVYTGDTYADKIYYALYEKCPSGQITGLQSIRETSKYPVVSGEIVKIRGLCLQKKTNPVGKKI